MKKLHQIVAVLPLQEGESIAHALAEALIQEHKDKRQRIGLGFESDVFVIKRLASHAEDSEVWCPICVQRWDDNNHPGPRPRGAAAVELLDHMQSAHSWSTDQIARWLRDLRL